MTRLATGLIPVENDPEQTSGPNCDPHHEVAQPPAPIIRARGTLTGNPRPLGCSSEFGIGDAQFGLFSLSFA